MQLLCWGMALLPAALEAQRPAYAIGADISWVTEMEAGGKKFYDASGVETDLFQLLKDLGMNSIRLRVWVNPETAYGAWSDKADVVVKAKRAHALGMTVMIDFHYSDFFTDPGTQTKPVAWDGMSFTELKTAVAAHTHDVLQALKDEGIEPGWVQVGNETRQGMVWSDGQLTWGSNINNEWKNYAALSNAGYDAVKEIFPEVPVIVHLNNAMNDNLWWYQAFKTGGGKFDMVGLSHYPSRDNYESEDSQAITYIKKLQANLKVPVMIVEVGTPSDDQALAYKMMKDFYNKLKQQGIVSGMFYWEPQVYGSWKPAYYSKLGWEAYGNGAFTSAGRPGRALLLFTQAAEDYAEANGIENMKAGNHSRTAQTGIYDLTGRQLSDLPIPPGIYIQEGKKVVIK